MHSYSYFEQADYKLLDDDQNQYHEMSTVHKPGTSHMHYRVCWL